VSINFNITILDLECEWASVDVVVASPRRTSTTGISKDLIVDVISTIKKWPIDADGIRRNTQYQKTTDIQQHARMIIYNYPKLPSRKSPWKNCMRTDKIPSAK
jgi:hypothetical protein